ncbi:hypothetical protein EEZ25_33555 [Micromonospora aurantiaca]|nr:hypothetical protein EEZ25_33555 [Micromonospora aurantiaca]
MALHAGVCRAPAAMELLIEIRGRIPGLLRRRVEQKPLTEADLNMTLVPPVWRRAALNNPALDGAADRDAYVMCLLTQLHAALRRRMSSPIRRCAGPTLAPGCWTGRTGRRYGARYARGWV